MIQHGYSSSFSFNCCAGLAIGGTIMGGFLLVTLVLVL